MTRSGIPVLIVYVSSANRPDQSKRWDPESCQWAWMVSAFVCGLKPRPRWTTLCPNWPLLLVGPTPHSIQLSSTSNWTELGMGNFLRKYKSFKLRNYKVSNQWKVCTYFDVYFLSMEGIHVQVSGGHLTPGTWPGASWSPWLEVGYHPRKRINK